MCQRFHYPHRFRCSSSLFYGEFLCKYLRRKLFYMNSSGKKSRCVASKCKWKCQCLAWFHSDSSKIRTIATVRKLDTNGTFSWRFKWSRWSRPTNVNLISNLQLNHPAQHFRWVHSDGFSCLRKIISMIKWMSTSINVFAIVSCNLAPSFWQFIDSASKELLVFFDLGQVYCIDRKKW